MNPFDLEERMASPRPLPRGRTRRARRLAWCVALGGSLAILAGGALGEGGLPTLHRLRGDVTRFEKMNDTLRVGNASLRDRIRAVKDDPDALEWLARSRLGYVRSGEVVVPLDPGEGARDAAPSPRGHVTASPVPCSSDRPCR